jgi:hypothetical protein
MGSTMSLHNANCPGVAFNVVWNVLSIAYVVEDKRVPKDLYHPFPYHLLQQFSMSH